MRALLRRPLREAAPRVAKRLARASTTTSAYETLGVSRTSTRAEIRAQFLELAKQTHPDTVKTAAERAPKQTRFAAISAAYEVLSDPARREDHDRELDAVPQADLVLGTALALAGCGRQAEGVVAFLSVRDAGAADAAIRTRMVVTARTLLSMCGGGGGGAPHARASHAQITSLWSWLAQQRGGVDGAACNAYFALCLRAGHHVEAMRAYKMARDEGLEQGQLMRSTVRQLRQWQESRTAT